MKITADATFSNATEVHGPGDYFVSVIDGDEYYLIAGPFADHQSASAAVDRVNQIACEIDCTGRAAFMAWGTCRLPVGSGRLGSLNRAGRWPESIDEEHNEHHEGKPCFTTS